MNPCSADYLLQKREKASKISVSQFISKRRLTIPLKLLTFDVVDLLYTTINISGIASS